MPEIRCGVRLTPLQAALYDRIKLAGENGTEAWILRRWLEEMTGRKQKNTNHLSTIVHQINYSIEDAGHRISNYKIGGRKDQKWYYFVKKI
jgi:hypothetical protein